MEEEEAAVGFEVGKEIQNQELELEEDKHHQPLVRLQQVGDDSVLRFLDSMDNYLTLLDSLSSTLRQGWLDLASARHSMGASRINTALLDLKFHSASTLLQVTEDDVDSMEKQPHFVLNKWTSLDNGKCCSGEQKSKKDNLMGTSGSLHLRHRGSSKLSEEKISGSGTPLKVDDQVQKERSKSLSMFGTLVSPKLRTAQLSFETAVEIAVEIANARSAMLSAFDQIVKVLKVTGRMT